MQQYQSESESSPSVDKIISSFNKNAAKKAQKRENLLLAYVMNATERDQRKSILISRLQTDLYESQDNVYLMKMENEAKEELLKAAEDKLKLVEESLKSKEELLKAANEELSALKSDDRVKLKDKELDALRGENQQLKAQVKDLSAKIAAKNTPSKLVKPEVKNVVIVKPTMSTTSRIPKFPTTPRTPRTPLPAKDVDSPSIMSLNSVARLTKSPSFTSKNKLGVANKGRYSAFSASPVAGGVAKAAPAAPVAQTQDSPGLKKRSSSKKSKETTTGGSNMTGIMNSMYNLRRRAKTTKL